jgi:hypothetical protein
VVLTTVTTWDPKSDTYYKYTAPPKRAVGRSVDVRVAGTHAVAWATTGDAGPETLTVETYGDPNMSWRSDQQGGRRHADHRRGGDSVGRIEGVAGTIEAPCATVDRRPTRADHASRGTFTRP